MIQLEWHQKKKKTRELATAERNDVIKLFNKGHSYRKISEMLEIPHITMGYIVRKYKTTDSVVNSSRSGRPPKLIDRDERFIR